MSMQIVPKSREESKELTVSEVTRAIKSLVEGQAQLRGIWIRGEVSNVRLAGTGHLYFTLKDENCQLKVAFFSFGRGSRRPPADGSAFLVHGDIRVYEARGEYQLVADDLIPSGEGDLAARFEALKRRLAEEGLFDEARKKQLPVLPQTVGVITSASTAALRDVLNVLGRRAPYLRVVLFPAAVQGENAAAELVKALCSAADHGGVEVILLVRGGGSIEDLWCFNDEKLARALADCTIPVITGVGHEIDFTIVDFVADRRAPTPSAAAELVAPDAADLAAGLRQLTRRLAEPLGRRTAEDSARLMRLFDRRLIRDIAGFVQARIQSLDAEADNLVQAVVARTHGGADSGEQWYSRAAARMGDALARRTAQLNRGMEQRSEDLLRRGRLALGEASGRVRSLELKALALDPEAPLQAGFALVRDAGGALVRDEAQLKPGEAFSVQVKKGRFRGRRDDVAGSSG